MSRPSHGPGRVGRQEDHPTVRRVREAQARGDAQRPPEVLDEAWLREVCLGCGADDVGFVPLERPELDDQRRDILHALPHARSVIVFVRRMNREPVRSPLRSLANTEFHHVGDGVTATSRDWVETVVESRSAADYRSRVSDPETISMWQSLSGGPNYKAANCVAVCPAGEDVIGPFLEDRKEHMTTIVKPLQDKTETLYVIPGTDAEDYAAKRFSHKKLKRVNNGVRVPTARSFLDNMVHVFQSGQADGLDATYHFTFTGEEEIEATVEIRDQKIAVRDGHVNRADLAVRTDSRTWVRFLAGEKSIVVALLTRRIRVRGPLRLLAAFGRCFPGA